MVGLLLHIMRLMVLAVLPLMAAATGPVAAQVALDIDRSDPTLTSMLALDRPLYVAVHYRSEIPLRLRVQAYYGGENVDDGLKSNPTVLYPAGSGTGLAWIAFDRPARVDRIDVIAMDDDWNPISVRPVRTSLRWTDDIVGKPAAPSWVVKLHAYEKELAAQYRPKGGSSMRDLFYSAITLFAFAALPLYLVLQPLAYSRFAGNWRLAAMAPLLVMAPVAAFTACAFFSGSNLWPLIAILAAPFAVIYLAGLFAAQRFAAAH